MVMDFETLEKDIAQLNRINPNANYTSRDRYHALYDSIYERLLEMEKDDHSIKYKIGVCIRGLPICKGVTGSHIFHNFC